MTWEPRSMIRAALKRATQAHHDALEHRMAPLLGPISFDDYGSLLKRLLGFYGPLEERILALSVCQAIPLDVGRRAKAHLLARDLRFLGSGEAELTALSVCEDLPDVSGISRAFGCLYVLEGATLGGQVIAEHLRQHLGLNEEGGCDFFASYGNEVGMMWRAFLSALDSYCRDGADGAILVGSVETFAAMDRWLFGGEHAPWPMRDSLITTPT
jgi:heme oxygenase